MTWLTATVPGATEFDRVFGLRPNLYDDYRTFVSLFWSLRPIDPVILELCRLRIAQLLGGNALPHLEPRAAGVSPLPREKIEALEDWRNAGNFSDRERACLAFAEKFVLQPHGVTEALAVFDGFTRFGLILGIESDG